MKKIVMLILGVIFCLNAIGQDATDTKKEINKIKRSQSYLSAEATMDTEEEAMVTAKELLVSEINEWVASKRNNSSVKQIVLQDISTCTQLMDMKRGIKTRAFVYVKKKDIVLIYGEGQIVLNDEEKGGVELQPLNDISKAESFESTIEPIVEQSVVTLSDNSAKMKTKETKSVEVVELQPVVEVLEKTPLERILAVNTMQELKPLISELKNEGKISLGVYTHMDSDCYLLFYNRSGEIKGILKQEAGKLENVRTKTTARITDYNGCGAYWFILK